MTGAVDGLLDQARGRLKTALDRVGHDPVVAGEISEADPLEAIEDAFATFAPDEVIVSTRWERSASGLEPRLAGLVRERFAVPVRHLVFEPGSAAQEPDEDTEARYRHEFGEAAARKFGLKALAGAGIVAAVLMSMVALVQSSEREEARAHPRPSRYRPVAKVVDLSVIAEYKAGPEGEKHDAFTRTEFAVRVGQPQQLRIDNTDSVPHSITAPAAGVNIVVMPGTHTYTLVVKQAGTFLWFCTFAMRRMGNGAPRLHERLHHRQLAANSRRATATGRGLRVEVERVHDFAPRFDSRRFEVGDPHFQLVAAIDGSTPRRAAHTASERRECPRARPNSGRTADRSERCSLATCGSRSRPTRLTSPHRLGAANVDIAFSLPAYSWTVRVSARLLHCERSATRRNALISGCAGG